MIPKCYQKNYVLNTIIELFQNKSIHILKLKQKRIRKRNLIHLLLSYLFLIFKDTNIALSKLFLKV
jgi:hypothetical protein